MQEILEWPFRWNLLHHKFHEFPLPAAFEKGLHVYIFGFTNFGWNRHFMAIQTKAYLAAFTCGAVLNVVKGGPNCWVCG